MERLGLAVAVGVGVVCLAATAVWATDPNQVEDLIREGIALRRAGSDGKALLLFQKAHEMGHTPRTAAQLGLVEFALGYALESERHLGQGLAAPSDPWIARNHQVLEETLTKVRTTIGEITVTGTPAGGEVFLNGTAAGVLPLSAPLRVSQGPATVELRASGYSSASSSIDVAGGKSYQIALNLRAALPPVAGLAAQTATIEPAALGAQPTGREHGRASSTRMVVGWSLAGAGAAATLVGIVLLATAGDGCTAAAGFMCTHAAPSKAPFWALAGAGAAVGIVGGVILITRPTTAVEVGFGPSSMLLRGIF